MQKEENLLEAIKYFKQNNGFKRMLNKMKSKYESFSTTSPGTILIENPSDEEKEALSGFMKKEYSKSKTISISLKKFQERLDETKFEGITIKQILDEYFEEEITTNKSKQIQYEKELELFFENFLEEQKNSKMHDILKNALEEKNDLFLYLKREYNQNKIRLYKELVHISKIINNPPKELTSIAIYAARILKNPHALDRDTFEGKLLLQFLVKNENDQILKNSEEIAKIYYKNNLLIDEVSNMVLCKNIIAYKNGIEHLGWKGFNETKEHFQATLYNLSKIDEVKVLENKVLVVENPSVFVEIASSLPNISIICTYGQVKLAGITLLDMIAKDNNMIYYSGDMDPEGLQIADKLKIRYKEKLEFVGFNKESYRKNMSDVVISDLRIKKLENIKSDGLKEVCLEISKNKRAAYEENNLETIWRTIWGQV